MIQRRLFLGSIAAGLMAAGTSTPLFGQDPFQQRPGIQSPAAYGMPVDHARTNLPGELNWQCKIIETLPHGPEHRFPVVTGVSIDPAGNLIAIVGDDHCVCVYDLHQDKYVAQLEAHEDWVRVTEFSPAGNLLATAGNDRTLRIWNTDQWQQTTFEKTGSSAVIDVDFSSNGQHIAAVGFESTLRVYDTSSGMLIQSVDCACEDNHAVAFSPDDQLIAAGGRNGIIRIWQTATWQLVAEFQAHAQRIRSLEFDSNGRLISCGEDQIVRVTDLSNTSLSMALPRHAAKLFDVAILDAGTLATSGSDNRIHIWKTDRVFELGILAGHTGTVSSLAVAGSTLVSGSYDTQVRVWSMERQAEGWSPGPVQRR
ncbi:MAG: WD40 repeat domain-containing protein [Planctomycetota bacterium]